MYSCEIWQTRCPGVSINTYFTFFHFNFPLSDRSHTVNTHRFEFLCRVDELHQGQRSFKHQLTARLKLNIVRNNKKVANTFVKSTRDYPISFKCTCQSVFFFGISVIILSSDVFLNDGNFFFISEVGCIVIVKVIILIILYYNNYS